MGSRLSLLSTSSGDLGSEPSEEADEAWDGSGGDAEGHLEIVLTGLGGDPQGPPGAPRCCSAPVSPRPAPPRRNGSAPSGLDGTGGTDDDGTCPHSNRSSPHSKEEKHHKR